MSQTRKIYFTSDTHYAHANICGGTSKWTSENSNDPTATRNFATIDEMNDAIVNGINSLVGEDDILYHLGDWSFGGWHNIYTFRKRIKCKNIHLILGNHDDHIRKDKFFPHLQRELDGTITEIEDPSKFRKVVHSNLRTNADVHAQDFFTSINKIDTIKHDGKVLVLCHFPMEEWELMDSGSFHLHGHCHGNLPVSIWRREDVGLDAQNFAPISFDEVIERLLKRKIKPHNMRFV